MSQLPAAVSVVPACERRQGKHTTHDDGPAAAACLVSNGTRPGGIKHVGDVGAAKGGGGGNGVQQGGAVALRWEGCADMMGCCKMRKR
jgi:hypothetical protein